MRNKNGHRTYPDSTRAHCLRSRRIGAQRTHFPSVAGQLCRVPYQVA
nr:MAG TPA: hypothetical protein [Caudoviricetes sp.]